MYCKWKHFFLPVLLCFAFAHYRDTICDLDGASELANYGEYSGAPSEQQTYEYAKTVLSLMTDQHDPRGQSLNCKISDCMI